jgi:predicted permease
MTLSGLQGSSKSEPNQGGIAVENFIATLAYLLIGMGLRRLPSFHRDTGLVLNGFVIHISLPAMVLLRVPQLTFSSDLLILALTPWFMLAVSWALVVAAARLFAWDRPTVGCLLLLAPLANTSFFGVPMVRAFFGDHAIPYALFYDQFGSFLALATYGSLVLALYGTGGVRPTIRAVAKKIVVFPPFLALLCALALHGVSWPPLLKPLLETLAATLVPVVMIAVGFQLTLRLNRAVLGQLSAGLLIKLVCAPLAAVLACRLFGLEGETVRVACLEAGMPPMVAAGALAIMANLSPPLAAAMVGVGVLLSFVTLPLLYQLLHLL